MNKSKVSNENSLLLNNQNCNSTPSYQNFQNTTQHLHFQNLSDLVNQKNDADSNKDIDGYGTFQKLVYIIQQNTYQCNVEKI